MKKILCLFRFSILFSVLILGSVSFTAVSAETQQAGKALTKIDVRPLHLPEYRVNVPLPDTILIPESMGWLVSLYVPYFDLLKKEGRPPSLLAVGLDDANDVGEINELIQNERVESLASREFLKRLRINSHSGFTYTLPEKELSLASLGLLERYVIKSPDIVVAGITDLNDFMQASLYAACFQLPLILIDRHLNERLLKDSLEKFGVRRLIVVASSLPEILESLPENMIRLIHPDGIQSMLIEKSGAENVKSLLIASTRAQSDHDAILADDAVMFIPFISYLRKAPVLLSKYGNGRMMESLAYRFIDRHHLRPVNLIILGNYSRIRTIDLDEMRKKDVYKGEMELEPGTDYTDNKALSFGIGRLPYNMMSGISMYYTRLLHHDRYYAREKRSFAMISNVEAKDGANLLFAEALSKLTVKELRNFGLNGKTFYRENPLNSKMWRVAANSGLIIYEGHSDYFLANSNDDNLAGSVYPVPGHFKKFPLLILQSCNGQDDIELMADHGLIGIVGSSTRIHSASGSSFIKAYMDFILYENATLGEALRDTKNYFLGIVALKNKRGHKEQAKANRVALTFRLWGDPEIRLYPRGTGGPKLQPVYMRGDRSGSAEIRTPDRFYKKIENEQYRISPFPGSKQAGFVKSLKSSKKSSRRIESFYFFKMPFRNSDLVLNGANTKTSAKKGAQTIMLEDPLKRWVYLLYYPGKEKKNATILLKSN